MYYYPPGQCIFHFCAVEHPISEGEGIIAQSHNKIVEISLLLLRTLHPFHTVTQTCKVKLDVHRIGDEVRWGRIWLGQYKDFVMEILRQR